MPSFSSRLGSWLQRKTDGASATEPPDHSAPSSPAAAPEIPKTERARNVRLGLDFGTTTTLVAVRVDSQEPRLVPLETATDWLSSYYWRGDDGLEEFGARAENRAAPVHSIKLDLPIDLATTRTYGMRPSEISLRIIEEALRRALVQLKRDRLIPDRAERLEVATNVGCSAAWDLTTRARLRDIACDAGLEVSMANLIEEPVAAALAVSATGAFGGGRLLLVDMGGGTLDTCVLKRDPDSGRFTIFASNGRADLGGDRYTELIVEFLRERVAAASGQPVDRLELSTADEVRLWQVAEQAKRDLSTRTAVRVQLPGMAEDAGDAVTMERPWFERASAQLIAKSLAAVNDAYRLARLVLDRTDDLAGTPYLSLTPLVSIGSVHLKGDGLEHLDHVVLVGGASQMPLIRRKFTEIFGVLLEDPTVFGLDPVSAVAIGLARHEPLESLDFGYPNWAVSLEVVSPDGMSTIDLYTPFSPVFKLRMAHSEVVYQAVAPLPPGTTSCRLLFRRVSPGEGVAWREVRLPAGADRVQLELSLLGDFDLTALAGDVRTQLYPDHPAAPWKQGSASHPDWLPKPVRTLEHVPMWDPVNDGPG